MYVYIYICLYIYIYIYIYNSDTIIQTSEMAQKEDIKSHKNDTYHVII